MKNKGKVVEFDPEAAHAASVMKDEAVIINAKNVHIPSWEELVGRDDNESSDSGTD